MMINKDVMFNSSLCEKKKTLANGSNRNLEGAGALGWAGRHHRHRSGLQSCTEPIKEHLLCPVGAGHALLVFVSLQLSDTQ